MKCLLPVLLLASLGLAQIFGPAGVPLSWDFGIEYFKSDSISASKLTSPSATSYLSFTSSAAADSLVWTQTQAAGDNDMVFKWVDDSGDAYNLFLDDANDWLQFPASAFGNLITPDDGGMVAIFDRDVTGTPADGTAQGVILRVDTVDVLSAGALADGSGSVDSVFVEFHGDVITESGYYGWTGSWVNAESDTVKVENGIIYDVVSP